MMEADGISSVGRRGGLCRSGAALKCMFAANDLSCPLGPAVLLGDAIDR
jgi:hypothetical protein